jgi:hypothetical protein
MADRYIDYAEVSEYGRFFVREVRVLVGASPLVDMEALAQRVLAAVEAVEAEVYRAQMHGSGFRVQRGDSQSATRRLRDQLRRFHYHLKTLPSGGFDFDAFFANGKLDGVHRLKPADLVARADYALTGFTVPANSALPGAQQWQATLQDARDALAAATSGRQHARNDALIASTDMVAARERFLELYNGVAKPLVRGVLRDLGRADEYRRFFRDLQVNESGRPANESDGDEADGAG